ncbi:MAG TPA: hypothetical protein GX505_14485 [Clostridiales bacterium]|nr:hypothetical protein [Clostridiales bacterium]
MFSRIKKPAILAVLALLSMVAVGVPVSLLAHAEEEKITTDTGYVVFRIGDPRIFVKGPNVSKFDPNLAKRPAMDAPDVTVITTDALSFIEKSRTYVPVRYLANALGVADKNVAWDAKARKVTLSEPGMPKVEMTVGVNKVLSNGKATATDVAPVVKPPGRTMLPAKWVAEALGYTVEWDETRRIVLAYRDKRPSDVEIAKLDQEFAVQYVPVGKYAVAIPPQFKPNGGANGYKVYLFSEPDAHVKIAVGQGQVKPGDASGSSQIFIASNPDRREKSWQIGREVLLLEFGDPKFVDTLLERAEKDRLIVEQGGAPYPDGLAPRFTAPDGRIVWVESNDIGVTIYF